MEVMGGSGALSMMTAFRFARCAPIFLLVRPDRAVPARNDDEGLYVDLTIYLGVDSNKLDPAREPSIVKRRLASGHLHEMTAKGNGSLRVESRCGGCSNDDDTVFTIVYCAGDFLVGGENAQGMPAVRLH